VSYGAMDCRTGLTGGSKVYQPTTTGFEEIYNGDWDSFFASGPTTPANHDKDGNTNSRRLLAGCGNSGTLEPNWAGTKNGYNWNGDQVYNSIGDPANWFVMNNASWGAYSGMSFYCAIDVNGTSSVTRTLVGDYPALGDWVIWLTNNTFAKNTEIAVSGGVSAMDGICQTSSSIENSFDNNSTARAVVSGATHSCARPEFTGGSSVWTPNAYGAYDEIYIGDVSNVFSGSIISPLKDSQGNSSNSYFSGCDGSGNTSNNCTNWTDTTSTAPAGFNYTWSGTGSSWLFGNANQCSWNSSMRVICAQRIQLEFQFP